MAQIDTATLERSQSDPRLLYKGRLDEVRLPVIPNLSRDMGAHVIITSGHDRSDAPRDILRRYLLGLGVAKVIAESGITQDAWANTRLEKGNVLSIYGRNPDNPDSWRRPVVANPRKSNGESFSSAELRDLTKLFGRYLPLWEDQGRLMRLFPKYDGPAQEGLVDIGHAYKLVEMPRHDVVLIKKPHLDGLHFVVSPKEGFARQWQTRLAGQTEDVSGKLVQASVEGWGIAEGILDLFGNRGEIHNSGNWADALQLTDVSPAGRVSRAGLSENKKLEKRSHRPDIAQDAAALDTHTHTHVYIPRTGYAVTLPSMKLEEAQRLVQSAEGVQKDVLQAEIDHWQQLPQVSPDDLALAQSKLQKGKLSTFIATQLRGPLIR